MAARVNLRASLIVVACLVWAPNTGSVRAQDADLGSDAQRESGKNLYLRYCAQCHGEKGDGQGYATPHLLPKPRDFTTGKFKVRSTPSGALPTHQDLVNIIRRGMPYTSMPGWPNLTDQQISDIAYFIKTFSPEFANPANAPQPVPLPGGPGATDETIELGKKLYAESGCIRCHGTLGRGDGPSAPTLVDDQGNPLRAADLAQSWTFRGGSSREDIFRTMTTGFNGTPMPSFLEALSDEQRWAITDFIVSLSGEGGPGYTNLLRARHVPETIDLEKGTAAFDSAPVARFPIIGQIMEPGRAFHPPTTSLMVQAIYDAESIAVRVRWHDMSAERSGKNSPSLPVPREEEEGTPASAAPAEGGAQEGGVWGDEAVAAPAAQEGAPDPQDPFAEPPEPAARPSEFSDAVAIQIPTQVPAGARKPYFLFGDSQNPVDLWFFDLAGTEPLQFTGRGSAEVAPNDTGEITGVANYDQGEWSVIFKRPLRAGSGSTLTPGGFMPIAFSVWDGFSRERGNRRGLSLWYSLYLEPETVPSAVGPMIQAALLLLVLELALIGWVRWRYGAAAREPGSEGRQQPAPSV
jgi:mono/diheme cytochrome c family protein